MSLLPDPNEFDSPMIAIRDPLRESMRGLLAPGKRLAYVLAGDAVFTIRSLSTDVRFTFRVQQADGPKPLWFVRLLSGPDNRSDYQYLGILVPRSPAGYTPGVTTFFRFVLTAKSRCTLQAPSVRAMSWLVDHFEDARAEVWHDGSCGRCGRRLTVPESIASGIGPTCAGRS